MENAKSLVKRLKSCFICDVEIYDDHIVLGDAKSNQYLIRNSNKEAVSSFTAWFKEVYLKCVPQSLAIVDYDIEEHGDEVSYIVNHIISSPVQSNSAASSMKE